MTQYNVIVGCYGARRGTTLAELTTQRIRDIASDLEVAVSGRGIPSFMEGRVDHPVEDRHINAIAKASDAPYVERAVKALAQKGRKPAKAEELRQADKVYAVCNHALDEYAKIAGQHINGATVLDGAELNHAKYGRELDDTETTMHFINEVIVPKITGKRPAELKEADSTFYTLDGRAFRAGNEEAVLEEAKDLVYVADRLAHNIVNNAKSKR